MGQGMGSPAPAKASTTANVKAKQSYRGKGAREDAILRDLFRASAVLSRKARGNGASRHEVILGHLATREQLMEEGTASAPFTQSKLAQNTGITSQSLGETLGRMEGEGLITRRACECDKRSLYVELTDAGREVAASIMSGRRKFACEMLQGLDADEKKQLAAALAKLNAAL